MGRGGAKKMNHPMIVKAVDEVLEINHLMKYDLFKESVVLRYIDLSRTAIMNRNDWQSAWKRCARTALKRLNEYDDWTTETVALRIACLENPNETLYCVGYDYFHNQTSSGVYLGSSTNITNSESQNWIKQHSKIEEEFPNCKFVYVGKDIGYPEFEKMLHK